MRNFRSPLRGFRNRGMVRRGGNGLPSLPAGFAFLTRQINGGTVYLTRQSGTETFFLVREI